MQQYAVALSTETLRDFGEQWIEFYWADDNDHANEQARDAHPGAKIIAVAVVPV